MRLPLAASFYEVIVAVHIMAVVIAFGVIFAYPFIFAVAARVDPKALPLLHRIEYTIERWLINPGLLLVVVAGIYLASDAHRWSEFFVQWGLGASIVIGALVGSVMIPTAKRAERLARVAAEGPPPGEPGADYLALARRLSATGALLSLLVLVTILFMVIQP